MSIYVFNSFCIDVRGPILLLQAYMYLSTDAPACVMKFYGNIEQHFIYSVANFSRSNSQ